MLGAMAIVGGLVGLLGAVLGARQLRKERPFSPLQLAIGAGSLAAGTGIYLAFTRPDLDILALFGAIAAGAVVGYGEARFTTLRQAEGGALLTRASGGYLVIWGAAFAATTVLGQVDRGTPHSVGAALQVGAVATALVSNAALFLRRNQLVAGGSAPRAMPPGRPATSGPQRPVFGARRRAFATPGAPPPPAAGATRSCGACGSPAPAGQRFCSRCGSALA